MWTDYRKFIVDRIVAECGSAKSVYLVPADGGPVAPYAPGQHLPIRLHVPGGGDAVQRFYTISDHDPAARHYRLTVKKELPPADRSHLPPGTCSTHFNEYLKIGDAVEAKAPSGRFFIDLSSAHPIVLIAGGIGVTPMIAMINAIAREQPHRHVWFFHALRNAADHAFRDHLLGLAQRLPHLRLETFYEQPTPADRLGIDYHRLGRLDVDHLRRTLPTLDLEYYICGPGPMMKALTSGLAAAGVDAAKIRTETFASAPRLAPPSGTTTPAPAASAAPAVVFARTGKTVPWDGSSPSILTLAESVGVEISSGCLYGDCGTCMTRVLAGEVVYNHPTGIEPSPGTCLPCSCRPKGLVVLDV
jgi:ferredoxin-NADP reductase